MFASSSSSSAAATVAAAAGRRLLTHTRIQVARPMLVSAAAKPSHIISRRTLATAAASTHAPPSSRAASGLGDPADQHAQLKPPTSSTAAAPVGFDLTQRPVGSPDEVAPVGKSSSPSDERPIYLDYQATTPTDPRVVQTMLPYFSTFFGNPHSRTHAYGWESEAAVDRAREQIATLIGADPKEVIFTSGATESNNLAIKGVARFYRRARGKNHIITTQTEHKCVLDSCRVLQEDGFEVTYLPVQQDGRVRLEDVKAAIRPETAIVSVMTVNNEIGVIQPIKEIGEICRKHKVHFHTDAAQAVGKIPIDVNALNVDLMSISGHKVYGPKGIGALYVRRRPRVRLEPLISGGGQERGLRSGTVPTPLVVGLGEACRIAAEEMDKDSDRINALSQRLIHGITSRLTHVARNGSAEHTYPGCVNLSFAYVEGESLLMALKDVALSSGSACTSASLEPSYVLRALGAEDDMAHSSIRFGIGRFTTEAEVDAVADKVVDAVTRLREMSPLWEMVQEGIDLKTIEWSGH